MKIDLERLLMPISGARPSGEPLRYSGLYDQIQEARREDDPALPQGVWKTELKKADWPEVERLCLDALETRSKDLQLAAWLLEAWIHLDDAAGAAQGFQLLAGLCESYWDSLHPEIEGDDLESRLAPGVHFCGEVCDATGRLGGFNFQWAFASGFAAGRGAAALR